MVIFLMFRLEDVQIHEVTRLQKAFIDLCYLCCKKKTEKKEGTPRPSIYFPLIAFWISAYFDIFKPQCLCAVALDHLSS